jgi:sodium-dependent dicarboxylate transporter 2/3/5
VLLSAVLPNAVVAAALCPIAYAMIEYTGAQKTKNGKHLLNMILMIIVWGAGLGGFGTPLGGAMNLVAITHIENFTGTEFMFIQWVVKMLPYLALLSLGIVAYILISKPAISKLEGSGDYFKQQYGKLGKMNRAQLISLLLFALPVVLSFARPLYADIMPDFKPFFAFLLFGLIALVVNGNKSERLITWKQAEKGINWGLMILFSGGLAIGNLLIQTGALSGISELVAAVEITKALPIVLLIIAFSMFLSNASSNTAAVAVAVPLVLGIVAVISDVPLKYVYLTAAACNCAFLLPTSIRAIPVGYGLDTGFMLKKGVIGVVITFAVLAVAGYIPVIV